ncbi:MAG: ribosome biogenesis GTP-binding protein YihA/YsxC [Pseudomonadota bacterium]
MTSQLPLRQQFSRAGFVKEAHRLDQLPDDLGQEIAFVGRSNAGKSSVINCLCRRKNLARTSRTPGRTQQFVVFQCAADQRIIDLPGFGFAKVSKSKRQHWDRVIPRYLQTRQSLIGLVLVVDSRHPLKVEELSIVQWCEDVSLPILVLLNKIDKLNQKERAACRKFVGAELDSGSELVSIQEFSATKVQGLEQAFKVLEQWRTGEI